MPKHEDLILKIEDSKVKTALDIRKEISELLKDILKKGFPIGMKFKSYLVDRRELPEGLDWKYQITSYNVDEWAYSGIGDFTLKNLLSQCYIYYKVLDSIGRPNGKEDDVRVDFFSQNCYEVK